MTRAIVVGDRVVYTPPQPSPIWGGSSRVMEGVVVAVSGVSGLVLYAGERWPRWGPLERMVLVAGVEGQLRLL